MSAAVTEDLRKPLVSVCIPVLNGGDLVVRAVQSALDQRYPNLEVVVVDDASTDGTPELLRQSFGRSITLLRNATRAGQAQTTNRAVMAARGPLVKFLHHDDTLDADCVEALSEPLVRWPAVGLAFSRRRVEFAPGTEDDASVRVAFERPHEHFSSLEPLNSGRRLLGELIEGGLRGNWIGEPSNVMVRRRCFDAAGGFDGRTRHWTDFDLWLRLLAQCDAAFVDRPLSTYRRGTDSLTARNAASGIAWLDRLWMIEHLMGVPETRAAFPQLATMREQERHMAWRAAMRGVLRLDERAAPPGPWLEYMRWLLRRRLTSPRRRPAR